MKQAKQSNPNVYMGTLISRLLTTAVPISSVLNTTFVLFLSGAVHVCNKNANLLYLFK